MKERSGWVLSVERMRLADLGWGGPGTQGVPG